MRGKSTRCSSLSTSLPKDFVVLGDSFVLQDHELQVEDLELGAERYQKGRKGLKVCQFRLTSLEALQELLYQDHSSVLIVIL